MKRLFLPFVSMILVALSTTAWSAQHTPQDLPLVNGEHWTTADLAQKRAFLIGIGNVLEVEQARAALAAGAVFLVSPVLDEAVVRVATTAGVAMIPGTQTPTPRVSYTGATQTRS